MKIDLESDSRAALDNIHLAEEGHTDLVSFPCQMKSNAWRIPHDGIDQRRQLYPFILYGGVERVQELACRRNKMEIGIRITQGASGRQQWRKLGCHMGVEILMTSMLDSVFEQVKTTSVM
ncbi:hypothetical protein Y032_0006g3085 [Ancylostoma ceylanicum]|uniref:Uncharacterized protein n=1 Tax=Ancylostoma ceylanicum TaxID=53326 RepID=A0A016VSA6_9BILA|nr:hypothetical protein Y032_0006g3085 [Ancylostoma ceylanicum]